MKFYEFGHKTKIKKSFSVSTLTLAITAAERCFFILHLNGLAALRSVSLRLQSLNQKTLTDRNGCNGVSSRICFLIFLLIFFFDLDFVLRLIVP